MRPDDDDASAATILVKVLAINQPWSSASRDSCAQHDAGRRPPVPRRLQTARDRLLRARRLLDRLTRDLVRLEQWLRE
jgi:DNA topoisomerase VI subunit B